MTPCLGQPGHPQCADCARLSITAIMRPVAKLTTCAMFERSAASKRRLLRERLAPLERHAEAKVRQAARRLTVIEPEARR